MKQFLHLCIAFIFHAFIANGQQRFVNFDASIPSNWSVVAGTISSSNEHLKGGANALKWTPQSGSVITASSLAIPSSEIGSFSSSAAEFFIYSNSISADTLVFKFYDSGNVLRREGRMLLNYQGWRSYHRSYRYDYNNGSESSAFALNKIEIIYKPGTATNNVIFLDEFTVIGNSSARTPGPHLALDVQHFALNSEYYKAYFAWINQPTAATSASAAEQTAIAALKNGTYKRTLGTASAQEIADAKTFVTQCGITTNTDGSFKGRGIASIYDLDTLLQISTHVQSLARAYGLNNDADALAKLQVFLPYLLEQGLAEGGEIVVPYNDYTSVRNFPIGFLEALPYIANTDVKKAIVKMLKWSHEFNTIYNANPTPGMEMDFLHVKSNFLVELALLGDTDNEIARDLRCFSRYLEQFTYTGAGARDGIKPDGTGFHHKAQHISYQYAYGTWISRAFELKGTPFKISNIAYQNMKKAVKALFLETSKGAFYPNSASGRSPFPNSVPVNTTALDRLVQVGGDLQGAAIEPDLAAFYNSIFQTNRYAVPNVNLDGYYQLNYAQTGIMRKNNWVAVARGFTSKMFGAEIYTGANRYGRYQSYGALEVMYDGSLANTGYISAGNGWDWNMMPGTTTVRQSYDNLKPLLAGTASEFQASDFAGTLADGSKGVFGMSFVQSAGNRYNTSALKFKKSVFTLDSLMVCLGSDIGSSNASDPTITTLFQAVNATSNPSIYINSTTATTVSYNQALNVSTSSAWLVNAQTTGYYIPAGNADINIFRGTQSTPINTSDNTATTATANVSKVWLSHGMAPNSAKYSFVVVPATTPQKMAVLTTKIENAALFQIVRQSDTVHAVKYLPVNTTLFSVFMAKPDLNIGKVKGVSGSALFSVKEAGDTLTIKIASPDLNAVDDPISTWVSTVKQVTLSINGSWKIESNDNQASIINTSSTTNVTFSLKDGLSQTLVLVKDVLTSEELPGVWANQSKQWLYNLQTGTGLTSYGTPAVFQQGSPTVAATYSSSTSSAQSAGFLPYPPDGVSKVLIVNHTTLNFNGNFTLNGGSLNMSASALSSVNKFSAYELANATTVASLFFRINFSTTANNGSFICAIGNKDASTSNLFSNSSGVFRATPELFTALQWEFTSSGINFNFRESANSSGGTYKLISNTFFSKGASYDVEVYCNNGNIAQTYTRSGVTYSLTAGQFHIWARPANQLVKSSLLAYNSSTSFLSSGELTSGTIINSFLFQGINSTLPNNNAATIGLANMEVNFASLQVLPVQLVSFKSNVETNAVQLKWQTLKEVNTNQFELERSTDGKDYRLLTQIKAAGISSSLLNYQYKDASLPANTNVLYYRLRLKDKDGATGYDNTIPVQVSVGNDVIEVYPNPVSSKLMLSYPASADRRISLRLVDLSGRVILSQTQSLSAGQQQFTMDLSTVKSGVYIIEINQYRKKIIKL